MSHELLDRGIVVVCGHIEHRTLVVKLSLRGMVSQSKPLNTHAF